LIIADEPTTALDTTIQAQILELIASLQQDLGTAMLLITHDLGVVARVCDTVTVMYGGRQVESAPTSELFRDPRHRYTQALSQAAPSIDKTGRRLAVIPGSPPRGAVQRGCPFAPRCKYASELCSEMPETVTAPGRSFACWHPHDAELSAARVIVPRPLGDPE
jgi:oligopeptide/dipeptide ABC transporter ATP-binding protein